MRNIYMKNSIVSPIALALCNDTGYSTDNNYGGEPLCCTPQI